MLSSFWKFSTAGNTTLFVERSPAAALGVIDAEQAGIADFAAGSLTMAGGEFCANACLAYGAFSAMLARPATQVIISGRQVRLRIEGSFPAWHCLAQFQFGDYRAEPSMDGVLCHLPGISHMLRQCETFPAGASVLAYAEELAKIVPNPAAGLICWQRLADGFAIMPAVAAPGAGTCNLEQACGSGTLALASLFAGQKCRVRQPSGEILEAELAGADAVLSGPVHFLAKGEIWL
ncbi:MAG: hypothetical protein HDQ44_00675 [Desulfovibrio sp.]|nr:hypothetical protein [Desulfovibrio sp.]